MVLCIVWFVLHGVFVKLDRMPVSLALSRFLSLSSPTPFSAQFSAVLFCALLLDVSFCKLLTILTHGAVAICQDAVSAVFQVFLAIHGLNQH